MQITAVVKVIQPTVVVSDKFQKRSLIVTTEEQYPQTLEIQFNNDKADLLNNLKIGERVDVKVNIRGNEWKNPTTGEVRYFMGLNGWSISLAGISQQTSVKSGSRMGNIESNFAEDAIRHMNNELEDDLPF